MSEKNLSFCDWHMDAFFLDILVIKTHFITDRNGNVLYSLNDCIFKLQLKLVMQKYNHLAFGDSDPKVQVSTQHFPGSFGHLLLGECWELFV